MALNKYQQGYIRENLPAILEDMEIKGVFDMYIPAGGWEFQADFDVYWTAKICDLIQRLVKIRSESNVVKSRYLEVVHGMASAVDALKAAREFLDDFPLIKNQMMDNLCQTEEVFNKDFDFLKDASDRANAVWTTLSANIGIAGPDGALYDDDINFLRTFLDYILTDRALDVLMWVIQNCDTKYYTKLTRLGLSIAKEQVNRYAMLDNSTSEIAMKYKRAFAYPLSGLREGTAMACESLKVAKKNGVKTKKEEVDYKTMKQLYELQSANGWGIIRLSE